MPGFRKNARTVARTVSRGARTFYRGAVRAKRYHDDFKRRHPIAYNVGVKALHYGARAYYPARIASRFL